MSQLIEIKQESELILAVFGIGLFAGALLAWWRNMR
jgi:hypothetical protein